jgi:hypothetical protein
MQFVSFCHHFHVRMLKTFWTQTFPPSCICQLTAVQCSTAVPYSWTGCSFGNSLVSADDCQVGTELKTPQMLIGKRKWCNWTLSWTQYHKWRWSVVPHLRHDWCCRQALEGVGGSFQFNLKVFLYHFGMIFLLILLMGNVVSLYSFITRSPHTSI